MILLLGTGCSSGTSGHAPGLAGQQPLDAGTFTYPLAYIKRPPLGPGLDIDVRDLITSTTGGDVYIRDTASAGAAETNITKSITGGKGDVRDLDVSMDGKKLLFSLRLPLDPTKPNTDLKQPNWHVYQYDPSTKAVTQLTDDSIVAGHDVGAHYLPDGRIVFSSTRQVKTRQLLIDEGRPQYPAQTDDRQQPIFLLHVMNADGTDIHQISFNTNHDFAPSVLANGQIVFSRYEGTNGDQISLYRANPDGTGLELYYGANSHATGASTTTGNSTVIQFLNARQRADGKLVAIVRPFIGTQLGGDILQIDADNYVECDQPATPGGNSGTCAVARPGQTSATSLGVSTDANTPSTGGRFASVYPLFDGTNRMLVSWAPCFVLNTNVTPAATEICNGSNSSGAAVQLAPPAYTIWVYDVAAGTLSPVLASQPGLTIVDPVILQAHAPAIPFVADSVSFDSPAPGILSIRSVYDFDGTDTVAAATANSTHPVRSIAQLADPAVATALRRPARFIRIEKAVEIPDRTVRTLDANIFGPANMGMREILAYGPIEPDGSVEIEVPANVPFTIEILDVNARRIGAQHTSWLQLLPGETKTCSGCHTGGSNISPSHGRSKLTKPAYAGAAAPGYFTNTANYPALTTGDTMAQARAENTCQTAAGCSEIPLIDVSYSDVWTNPAVRPLDQPLLYAYADLTTQKPINSHCTPWDVQCRSNIDYPLHIQPLWSFVRQTFAADNATVLTDHTCTLCHNPADIKSAVQLPAGQLDLTASAFANDATLFTSYRQLLFPHNEQTLSMGVLVDYPAPAPGPPDPLAAPMIAGSANNSAPRFFALFDGTYPAMTQNHTGYLKPAELRLISEWLDIGAQYYNDPFVAPAAN